MMYVPHLPPVKYIEALKAKGLTRAQREDILGELSASITHLRIQAEQMDRTIDGAGQI